MTGFWMGVLVGGVGGGTVGFLVLSALVAASRSDDYDEYRGAREAVKEHLEEKEQKQVVTEHLKQWTSEP